MVVIWFVAGLLFLIVGAEALVRGASRLAAALGVSPLVIGLTVVAFGTSSPELAVSVKGAVSGQAGIALGNVIGSNIFNVLFILGLAALISPLAVSQQLVRQEIPLMIGVSALVLLMALDGTFGRGEGLLLLAGLFVYVGFSIRQSRREKPEIQGEYAREFAVQPKLARRWTLNIGLVGGGLALLVLGSRWLVDGAVSMAEHFGVSDLVIALTVVAAGTSLPEVVTSVVAALRGERDIAVGNVVGSNIFNLMAVLALAGIAAPDGIEVAPAVVGFDLPIMIAVSFACLPIFFTGGMISRPEGGLLLAYYAAYTLYLVLAASQHDALPKFSALMLFFAIPITLTTLVFLALREVKRGRGD